MSDLRDYFENNNQRVIYKWPHYFDIYELYFNRYRGEKPVILEIGVYHGGSLQMWKNYFGPGAKIYGIDINPLCKSVEEENIEVFIGSQSDQKFLQKVKESIPKIDILIDDGGHTMIQQKISFEGLFDHIKDNGIYLCEDIHTSYLSNYGGGYKYKGSFIEFSKSIIDSINAVHSEQNSFQKDQLTDSVDSIHYYENILVIEKKVKVRANAYKTGKIEIPSDIKGITYSGKNRSKLITSILPYFKRFLRYLRIH